MASHHSVFVLMVKRFSGTVGREKAWLPLRRFLAATAGWIKSVRCVWQTGDLVAGSESAFSVDKAASQRIPS